VLGESVNDGVLDCTTSSLLQNCISCSNQVRVENLAVVSIAPATSSKNILISLSVALHNQAVSL
jgi:hypothetical protein